MDYEQQLNDFIDGALDYEREMGLFAELSVNEHLRGELKSLIAIRDAVQYDLLAYMPAHDSTSRIFTTLGFAAGTQGARGMLGRFAQFLTGGLVGALATALFFLWSGVVAERVVSKLEKGVEEAVTRSERSAPAPAGTDGAASQAARGDVTTTPSASGAPTTTTRHRSSSRMTVSSRQSSESSSSVLASTHPAAPVASDVVRKPALTPTPVYLHEKAADLLEAERASVRAEEIGPAPVPLDASALPVIDPSVLEPHPVAFEYRALSGDDFVSPPAELALPEDARLLNGALGLTCRLDAERSIGIEIGRETFHQQFIERLTDGTLRQYRQSPVLLWGGATYRHLLHRSAGMNPYLQATLGATLIGPTARLLLGSYYEVTPSLRLLAGAEVSTLGYSLNGDWFFSGKYGVTYGFSINF